MADDLTVQQNVASDQVAYYTSMLATAQAALADVNAAIAAAAAPAPTAPAETPIPAA